MGMQIVSSAMSAPDRIQTAADLAPLIGKTAQWIARRSGVEQRRVGDAGLDVATLAARAARKAIGDGPAPDLILYAGGVPRQAIPDTSVFVSRELGYEGTPSFSINASCLSFLVALKTADSLLSDGTYSRILVCSADLATRARNMNEPSSAALLGDGAAAVVVEHTAGTHGTIDYAMKTWPSGAELAELAGGGIRSTLSESQDDVALNLFRMDGRGLLKLYKPRLQSMLETFLVKNEIGLDDIDLVIPHQTSKSGFQLLRRIGFSPDKTVNILADYGNCVSASMPMALRVAIADGRLHKGDLVMFFGTAAGASAAIMIVRW